MVLVALYSLASVGLVSIVSFVGALTVSLKESVLRKNISLFISLAVGALLGDVFIHMLPETFEATNNPARAGLFVVGGIFIFFLLERGLHWHHHTVEGEECEEEGRRPGGKRALGSMMLVSDGVHNLIDGVIIGASYMAGVEIGIATTIAVILHEIPQEIGDFGVLVHSGYSKARALFYNFLSALSAFIGVAIALFAVGTATAFTAWAVPVAAGGFIYIALADLIPEIQRGQGGARFFADLLAVLAGVLAMTALSAFG